MAEPTTSSLERVITFGAFRLLPTQRLLLEGDKVLRLGSRALDVLIALVERPGELVSKDELMARVWPNLTVEESNLKVHVAALRRVLGDGSDGKRYLATVTGRGYSFVAPVHFVSAEAPPQKTLPAKQVHNLPALLTRLIGRAGVVATLGQQMSRARLLTIIGPGGIGKTSVALAIAEDLIDDYRDGVWLVDLAPIESDLLVPSVLATVLGLEVRSDDPSRGLTNSLRDRQMLIVLDNCDHVIDGAAGLALDLLRGVPGTHILATSRERLRVESENVHRLTPLEVPSLATSIGVAEARGFSAVQLFIERATANVDEFEFSDSDIPIVSDICRKLDGIPLAIELAAVHAGVLGVRVLASLLADRLHLLTYGRRTALARHQTMRAALDWSHSLLTEIEQKTLRRLSVFAGGFTLRAAAAVAGNPGTVDGDTADAVLTLVAKSLVAADVRGAEPRYRLLETTRAYAVEKLSISGEREDVAQRHTEYFLGLLGIAGAARDETIADSQYAAYAPEIDNIRAALGWAFGSEGNAVTAVTLAAASAPLWLEMSLLNECHRWMGAGLARLDEAGAVATRREMVLQNGLGFSLLNTQGISRRARAALTRACEIAEHLHDLDYQLRAFAGLASYCCLPEDFQSALAFGQRAEATAKIIDDPVAISTAEGVLFGTLFFVGNYAQALIHARNVLHRATPATQRAQVVRSGTDYAVRARAVIAQILWVRGQLGQSAQAGQDALADAETSGHSVSICFILTWICPIALRCGDLETAERSIALLKAHAERHGLKSRYACALGYEGQLAAKRGDLGTAERSLRACLDGLRDAQYEILYTTFLTGLADILSFARRPAESLPVANEALQRVEQNSAFWLMPEALRIKGDALFLSSKDNTTFAEQHFRRSLELARQQGALSWALRTAMSFARMQWETGRRGGGLEHLAEIYGRFTEGFGTTDLRLAKRLLDDLA